MMLLFTCSPAFSRDRVENYGKLDLLNQATGQESSSGDTYQTRLDTILNPTETATQPETTYIGKEDTSIRLQAAVQEEAALAKKMDYIKTKSSQDSSKEMPIDARQDLKLFADAQMKEQISGTERQHNKDRLDIYKEIDKKRQLEAEKKKLEASEEKTESEEASGEDPLTGNPFYKGPDRTREAFEDSKPIIVSRLVEMGYEQDQAENIVSSASSTEDLVISLMQNEAFSFGDASELTDTSSS